MEAARAQHEPTPRASAPRDRTSAGADAPLPASRTAARDDDDSPSVIGFKDPVLEVRDLSL